MESKVSPEMTKVQPNQKRPVSGRSLLEFTKDHINSRLRRVKKIQFFTILFISSAILLVQTGQCVDKYFNKDTGTADKYVHVSKVSFPIMTVCPTYPYKLDRLQYHGIETKSDIQFGANWVSHNESVSPVELYEDVVLEVEDIVEDVDIYAEAIIEGKNAFLIK